MMKGIKRIVTSLCALVLLCGLMVPTSINAASEETSNVIVVCNDGFLKGRNLKWGIPIECEYIPGTEIVLGLSGSTVINPQMGLEKRKGYQSNVIYTTQSSKLYLRMKSSIKNPVRITIFNRQGHPIGQTTVDITATITFTNLSSTDGYFFIFENVGLRTVDITGTAAAK